MTTFGHYFDEETKEIHATKNLSELDDRGVGYTLFQQMKQWAKEGRTAQIDAITGHRDSFAALLQRSIRLAITLQRMGIARGDMISICSYNHLNSAVPYIAGQFIGATVAPTDPTISSDDQRHLLNLVKPKCIFVSHGAERVIEKALEGLDFECEVIAFARNRKYRMFHEMIADAEGEEDFEAEVCEDPTATCVILFSSGTTGLPKGICLNHYFIMGLFASMANLKEMNPRFMIYSTLYWISALGFQTICFYYGFERVVCTSFDAQWLWEYVEKYEVHVLFLAPVQAIQGLQHLTAKGKEAKPFPLKMLMMGGSAIAPIYYQQLRDLLPTTFVANGYGQTEVGFIAVFKGIDDNYSKLNSVGYLSTNMVARIVDPDTEEVLGLNAIGEIRVKPPYPMNGYYNQDSSGVWDEDGFVRTGDLGYFDDELCLYITDRIKEMFKYMSWHIVPAKLEAILQSHPDVQLAIVVGIPHPTDDNHACGAVTLMTNATISGNQLEEYVAERVDERNRLRAGVVVMDEMPLTPTGKLMRRELKQILVGKVQIRE